MDDRLEKARRVIAETDAAMADLFVRRMEAVREVAAYKKDHGLPVLDGEREQKVLQNGLTRVSDETLQAYYAEFLKDTMAVSRQYQQRLMTGLRVAYSGTEGAYAQIAASRLFPEAETVSLGGFDEAYRAVEDGDCDVAVLPLENSFAGAVEEVTDLLFSGALYINGTVDLSVDHDLWGVPGATLSDVTRVVSHPQALRQCRAFLKEHHLTEETYDNTARAADYVAQQGDVHLAAIAGPESGTRCGLQRLAQRINESRTNTTRFAVLSRAEDRHLAARPGAHFVLMFTVRNEAGALARALNILGAHGFNMRTLRSRPRKELLWQYYFYVEAEGNIHSHEGRCMMEEMTVCCDRLKAVGSFVAGSQI